MSAAYQRWSGLLVNSRFVKPALTACLIWHDTLYSPCSLKWHVATWNVGAYSASALLIFTATYSKSRSEGQSWRAFLIRKCSLLVVY